MSNLRDKIIGMFLGVAIGDALGMPVETMTPEEIAVKFGRVTKYLRPDGHKWFNGRGAGEWTDDWLFTMLIMQSLIEKGKVDMDDIAKKHLIPYLEKTLRYYGCGSATRKSLKNMANGIHWSESGIQGSAGNGVAMKISPIGALLAIKIEDYIRGDSEVYAKIDDIAMMTHKSRLGIISGRIQAMAIVICLLVEEDVEDFERGFVYAVLVESMREDDIEIDDDNSDKMTDRIEFILDNFDQLKKMSPDDLAAVFGDASCYVYNSLPFSLACFSRNPRSIEALYDAVNAGGDTDSTGSIVGALLGALNGVNIFPQHLIDGLWRKDEILQVANDFCDKFEIQ